MTEHVIVQGKHLARLAEWLLCTVVATALCYTVQGGFNVSDAFHGMVLLHVAVCLVLQAELLAGSFRPSFRLASGVIYAVIAIAGCGMAVLLSPVPNPIADIPQNYFCAFVIYAVVNVLVHALSRMHVTCIVLFGLGAFICGLTQFLYTTNMLVATGVFLLSAVMLIAFRAYTDTAQVASSEKLPLLLQANIAGLALPLIAGVLSAIVVFGIIMPLNPPHATIKLFNEYVSYEEEHLKTSVEYDEDADKRITSSTVDETLPARTTTDKKIDSTAEQTVAPENAHQNTSKDYLSGDYSDVDLSGLIGNMQSLALTSPIPWPLIIAGIIALLILLLTLPRYIIHRVRLTRIVAKEPAEQVRLFYQFFLGRFKKIGLEKPAELSSVEYANLYRERLAPFVGAQQPGTFDHLTALLVNQECAGIEPDAEDLNCMKWLYNEFYVRCRKHFGLLNYGFRRLTL